MIAYSCGNIGKSKRKWKFYLTFSKKTLYCLCHYSTTARMIHLLFFLLLSTMGTLQHSISNNTMTKIIANNENAPKFSKKTIMSWEKYISDDSGVRFLFNFDKNEIEVSRGYTQKKENLKSLSENGKIIIAIQKKASITEVASILATDFFAIKNFNKFALGLKSL